jgi:hypothetical protein
MLQRAAGGGIAAYVLFLNGLQRATRKAIRILIDHHSISDLSRVWETELEPP